MRCFRRQQCNACQCRKTGRQGHIAPKRTKLSPESHSVQLPRTQMHRLHLRQPPEKISNEPVCASRAAPTGSVAIL